MKIGIYYPWIYLKGGAERALCELVTRSRHSWTLYTNHYEPESTFSEFADFDVVTLPGVSVRRDLKSVALAAATVAAQKIDMPGCDRAVILSEGLGNLAAMRLKVPTTCICLTPLKVVYDQVTNERVLGAHAGIRYRLALAAYRTVDRRTWRRYDKVFCISETVRSRLLAHRLVDDDRIEVLYPGVDHERFRPGRASERFFLLPGRIMWQKNIEWALESWRFFKPHPGDNEFRLVIAGMVDAKSVGYLDRLERSVAWRDDVDFVCSPNDDTLLDLYRRARAVLFTAPSEDFGLVPLEAMACGKPVVALRNGGPTETVIEGETGMLTSVDPREFAAAMTRLAQLDDTELATMQHDCRARALAFDWKHFVGRIDDHLEEPACCRPEVAAPMGSRP